ncbi:valine--tRNA ligase [Candidatus Roizmanbacteria bacterium RIFOXYA1_FULL_41_12]|uniref:Valine--tRNA ligase n=1 Tax=Candidatus Roizmanbacteria bacterium RIFOXYA1_FULL_41_12 TaxID=1802082 RepID=A0A1F7K5N5_9BACT|nr:MAG: valine--tRNA ligase [Candidatus Roizmanbacteria bacterium RIFOXYA1_FULL_41_12]OGK66673.1 MAG: valine--tRNA ligase [Candidatus Roizmanbacteria bacterium RIFOXYA2_FULL_41_8]OGK67529.1 MAG: valine--tRNA ligase [Candidatus Roizmanbacteria bacterium RIFOXYB1_FULL_41_27]OGK71185.1 MAG: valine--tRNA ligase [Candidatus Roizmanbacteria bacterium RIFOXYC1_FULL_41_16]OGK74713.1 MAG: valine--tRNA ligase [Candidatus Roizmanbacteria bacterium RIFOXYD1_FULL_41_24]
MDKRFIATDYENKLYSFWEKQGFLKPKTKLKPFTILMPPPNANASLHAGHGMYAVDDILIRYKRIRGFSSLWIPGMDHAGFETQYVYEKQLKKTGKSRLDFDRATLYQNIERFVKDNSGLIYQQFKRLGFLADWSRSVFTLDSAVLERVYATFIKMQTEGYVYRDDYIVNYCPFCGTSLSELEVKHVERIDPLYYLKYGPLVLATVRPETKFGDTALAVHPKDKRYQQWIGKTVDVQGLLGQFKIKVIADETVDPDFGTGVVKITPAHDPHDFEVGKRHHLKVKQVINRQGRLNEHTGPYAGLKVKIAREKIVADLKQKGLIERIDDQYLHAVTVCYKCGRDLEPTIIPNWFIKVKQLKQPVIKAIKDKQVRFFPVRYQKQILQWLEQMHDWPISRQITWGIRIPAWYDINQTNAYLVFLNSQKESVKGYAQDLLKKYPFSQIEAGLQELSAPVGSDYTISVTKPEGQYLQETDTFDTWFSSGQWPLVTLKAEEYAYRFPTDVLGTLSDILPFWVSRMLLFSLYLKKQVPFKNVYLWSMVSDSKGQKMSKSKGNVINPIELVEKYGADAFRASLLFGVAEGSKIPLTEEKVKAMRNFANKIWNIGRFLEMSLKENSTAVDQFELIDKDLKTDEAKLLEEFNKLKAKYQNQMDRFQLSRTFGEVYEFVWHRLADEYLEALKVELRNGNIRTLKLVKNIFVSCLVLLHPFMPFVTEAVYQEFEGSQASLLVAKTT